MLYPSVPPAVVKERYTSFGGVVRFVLEKRSYSFKKLLQGLDREAAHRLLHLNMEDARSDVRHSLAHAQVSNLLCWMPGATMAASYSLGCSVHSSGSVCLQTQR